MPYGINFKPEGGFTVPLFTFGGNMKKIKALIIAVSLVLSLSACSVADNLKMPEASLPETSAPETSAPETDAPETSAPETDAPETSAPETSAPDTSKPDITQTTFDTKFKTNGTIKKTKLYDKNDVVITADKLTYDEFSAYLTLTFQNNSDKTLTLCTSSAAAQSMNGYMISGFYLNCTAEAGKSVTQEIELDYYSLLTQGINEIADIELCFDVRDENYDSFNTGVLPIKTSIYNSHDYSIDYYQNAIQSKELSELFEYKLDRFTTDKIYSEEGVSIISSAVIKEGEDSLLFMLEAENTSDKAVIVGIGDFSINGIKMTDSDSLLSIVGSGKKAIFEIPMYGIMYREAMELCEINTAQLSFSAALYTPDYSEVVSDYKTVSITVSEEAPTFNSDGSKIYSKNGLTVLSKGLITEKGYSNSIIAVFILKNDTNQDISIFEKYDTFTVNGKEATSYSPRLIVEKGGYALFTEEISSSSLEELSIDDIADIKTVKFTLSATKPNEHDTLFEAAITVKYDGQTDNESSKPDETSKPDEASKPSSGNTDEVNAEIVELMTKYETAVDDYVELMQKYEANPDDVTLITEMLECVNTLNEVQEELDAIDSADLSEADANYMQEVNNRVMEKMNSIS